jgi:hypothetical protein
MTTMPIKASTVDLNGTFDVPPTIDEFVELKSARSLDDRALGTIFIEARTASGFVDRPLPRDLLARAVNIALMGPTSANSLPLRIVFVETAEAKERLRPAMAPTNLDKTMAAPVTAIIAVDLNFYDKFPRTFPERGEMFKDLFGGYPPDARRGMAWETRSCRWVISSSLCARSDWMWHRWLGSSGLSSTTRFFPTDNSSRKTSSHRLRRRHQGFSTAAALQCRRDCTLRLSVDEAIPKVAGVGKAMPTSPNSGY